jgi:SET family sugar efflux transporter-like MFS transporter
VNQRSRTGTPVPATPESGPERRAPGVLVRESVPLGGAIGLVGLTAAALSPTLSLFLANAVHAAPFLIGLFFTAYAAAEIVAGLVTGWLSDRTRDRRVLIGLASLVGAVGMLCLALFRDYAVLLVTCMAFTSIGAGSLGQLFAYANEFATARGRDVTAYSSVMRSVFSGAYVVGAPLGLALMVRYGFRPLYLGVTVITLVLGALARWGLRPVPRKAGGETAGPEAGAGSGRRGLWRTIREARLPGRVWLLLGVVLALGTVLQMYGIDISLHVTKNLGRSPELVGWMVGLTAVMEIPVMIIAGRGARRLGRGRLVGAAAVLAVVSYCLMAVVSAPEALLGVAALTGVWQGVALSIPMVMVQQETPGGVGVSSSVYGAVFSAAGLIAGAVTGGAAALVGYGGVLWVCAALSAVAALGMLARPAFPRTVPPVPVPGG